MPFGGTSVDLIRKNTEAVRRLRIEQRKVTHTDPDRTTKTARTRLEKSLTAWMKHHGGAAFDQPFSADHKRVIAKIEEAINGGGLFALAMPRGHGKSTLLKWATLYCLLTGRRKFVVVIAATAEMAQGIIEFVRQQIQESDTLHAHYPHVTAYARATDGKAIKAKYQLRSDGKTSGIHWSKTTLVLPESLGPDAAAYPSNGAILEGHGLTGAIRGKWKDTKTGKVLRPDFVLIDDPQTRESAESESQCNMRERIITGDVLGLAGPRKKIAAVMPCTIVRKGDLADRFLDHKRHPEWSGLTTRLIEKWPDEQKGLWREYAELYQEGVAMGDGPGAAYQFYRANRDAMDAGAVVSWASRVRDGEISALHTAENLLIETGEQFWAEYQNKPLETGVSLYTLNPDVIMSRTTTRQPGVVPEWSRLRIAATDVNPSYGLTWALLSFGQDQTSAVLTYGVHKTSISGEFTKGETDRAIYEALVQHGKQLASAPCRPESWFIDAGGAAFDVVLRFCAESVRLCGIQAIACTGRGARNYRPYGKQVIGKQREGCHMASDPTGRKWIAWNADYWREMAQKAWTGSIGAPGSCSLPSGHHRTFAEQICREQLQGKAEVGGQMVWVWSTQPGPHDYGDCMGMCYMGAAWAGIGTVGVVQVQQIKRRPRSSGVIHL